MELTFNLTEDRREPLKPQSLKDFELTFGNGSGVNVQSNNWVQGRLQMDNLRQTFVNIQQGKDNEPFDITGYILQFCGRTPFDGKQQSYRVIDNSSVVVDGLHGRFRYTFPAQAFAVAGIYKQAYFRLIRLSDYKCIATLEFDLSVLEDFVFADMVPSDYISPFNDILNQLLDGEKKFKADTQTLYEEAAKRLSDAVTQLTQLGTDVKTTLATEQAALQQLIEKIKENNPFTQAEADAFKQAIQSELDKQTAIINGLKAKWHDIEVVDYKPTRDGKAHTLSESYASVDEAQKDYPAATSLADTKDWCAITEAIQEGQKQGRDIYLAPGQYVVNRTVTLPTYVKFYGAYQNSQIFASQQMGEDSKKQPVAILESDEARQPQLFVDNLQVLGTEDQANHLIGLHLGANRASRFVNVIVNNCYEHGTYIHATNENSYDVENPTFEHYWQVQSGSFRLETNPNIAYGNITDAAIHDSQITSLDVRDDNKETVSQPAVEIINANGQHVKTIYGVAFDRCFLHAQANNLVRIVGNDNPRATHSITFDFIKGELHDKHGKLGAGSDPYFIFHLENCSHIMIDHSSQLAYSGASFVELVNSSYCDLRKIGIDHLGLSHPDSMIFTADKYSCENTINLMLMDIYHVMGGIDYKDYPTVGSDFGNAYDAMDLFSHMRDEGIDNHIIGDQIGQTLTLNNEPHRLKEITSGKIDGLMSERQIGVTSSTINGSVHTKHVFAKGVQKARLILPTIYQRTSGYLISLRAIGAPSDIQKLEVLTGSNFFDIPTDQKFHYWTGICPTNVLNSLGIQMKSDTDTLENDVTIEIEYLDCFMENKIPYYPDFVALPAPKVGEANY